MSKYIDLQIECQRMWNKKVWVLPVSIGVIGIVDRSYVGKISGSHNIYNLQILAILAILGTAHFLSRYCLWRQSKNSTYKLNPNAGLSL